MVNHNNVPAGFNCGSCGTYQSVPSGTNWSYVVDANCAACNHPVAPGGALKIVFAAQNIPQPLPMSAAPKPKTGRPKIPSALQKLMDEAAAMVHVTGSGKGAQEPEPKETNSTPTVSDPAFRSRLLSIMTDNKFDRTLPKRRKDKLDSHHLWRAHVGAENVFRQKQERKNKDYHVVLLIDSSGSMYDGGKIQDAIEITLFLAKEFDKAGIKFTVIGFDDRAEVYKKASVTGKKIDYKKLEQQILSKDAGTQISTALDLAYEQFEHDKHGKVLIVFSDGEGCNYPDALLWADGEKLRKQFPDEEPGTPQSYAAHPEFYGRDMPERLHSFIASHEDVHTIGVGIQDRGVEASFPNHIFVDDLNDFKPKVLDALKSAIKRG